MTFATNAPEETARAGALLARVLQAGDVVALAGDLGAGKTHLVQGVATGLGVSGSVTSPTFNLLVVHQGRLPLYHFDLYRLERASELEDIGFYDMLDADGVAMIEWGDRFPEALPDDHLLVLISREGDDRRRFEVQPTGPRSGDLAAAWVTALRDEVQTR